MEDKLVSLLAGPTDKTKIFRFTSISPQTYEEYLARLAVSLVKHIRVANVIPDKGVPLDLAKKFREAGGKVCGYLLTEGLEDFKENFQYCDKIIEFDGGWSALNTCLSLKGDIITVIGMSPGTSVEIAYTKYHKRYLGRNIPILIDVNLAPWTFPEAISEDIDLRYFNDLGQLEELLEKIRSSRI
jgi:hypothetical protein